MKLSANRARQYLDAGRPVYAEAECAPGETRRFRVAIVQPHRDGSVTTQDLYSDRRRWPAQPNGLIAAITFDDGSR